MSTVLIDDQDPSITYTGTWVVGGTIHEHDGTVSSSVKVGDHFSVPFNGTGITVFGTFDATSTGVKTLYSIDGDQGTVVTSQASGNGLDDFQQPFWKSGTLSDGNHILVVTMRAVNSDAGDGEGTVWFDYFQVTGAHPASSSASPSSSSTASVSSSSTSPSPSAAAAHSSSSHGGLIGGVVAAAAVVVVICIGLLLWRRRRRQRDFTDSTTALPFGGGPPHPGPAYPYPTPAPMASLSSVPSATTKVGALYGNTQPYGYGPIPQAPLHDSAPGTSGAYPGPYPMAVAYHHHQPSNSASMSTSAAGTSSYAGSSTGDAMSNITDMKRRQQEVVASYEQGVNGRPLVVPAPVQHVDSGIRELDVNDPPRPAEIPPVYTAQ